MYRIVLAATAACLFAPAASAIDIESAMTAFLDNAIRAWASEPLLLDAVAARNAETAGIDADRIDALDRQWRAEVGTSATPLIDTVLATPASDFLRAQVVASNGMVTEIFIMDAVGLNVASSGTTSDYWQGDEEKFTMTFPLGAGAVHMTEVEFDESTQTYSAQISIPLIDSTSRTPIGAMTVGINAEALM